MATMPEIKVAAERAVHDAIAALLQGIFREHGIQVNDIRVEWIDVSTTTESTLTIRGVEVTSITRPRGAP